MNTVTIIQVMVFFIFFLPLTICTIVIIVHTKKIGKKWRELKKPLMEQYPNGKFFPVRCSSKKFFDDFWKVSPWESVGYVVFHNNEFIFMKERMFEPIIMSLNDVNVSWIGLSPLKNGALSWIKVDLEDQIEYLSGSGVFVFGARKNVKTLLRTIEQKKRL